MRLLTLIGMLLALCGCTTYVPGPNPTLVLSDGFRGEVLLVGDKEKGIVWKGDLLVVPRSGVLLVSNLGDLAAIRPDAYEARYASGARIGNRRRGGDWNEVGLWPISTIAEKGREAELIFLVIGTYDMKTEFDNARMGGNWRKTIETIRAGKPPKQLPEPTSGLAPGRGSS